MRKPTKILLITAGALVVLVILAAVVLPLVFPTQRATSLAVRKIEAATGRDIDVESAAFHLFPRVRLELTGLTVGKGSRPGSANIALEKLSCRMKLLPLLGGKVTITDFVVVRPLVPFDFARFPPPAHGVAPRITLPAEDLLARLAEEYVFAEIVEAVMLSFAAENEARMRAMIAAHDNVSQALDQLLAQSRLLRQEEITEEITALATSSLPVR